jgi:SEC-C motif-containing protein
MSPIRQVTCPCGSGSSYDACCGRLHRGAAYRTADGAGLLHERSRFERRAGRWVYVDGDLT